MCWQYEDELASLKKKLKALKTAVKKADGEAVVLNNKEPVNEKAGFFSAAFSGCVADPAISPHFPVC